MPCEDHQRESLGRVVAVLFDADGSSREGSIEALASGVPTIVLARGRVYMLMTPSAHVGKLTYVETVATHSWEFGSLRCSARESGGFRCSEPANHPPGAHKYEDAPILLTDRCAACGQTREAVRKRPRESDRLWCFKRSWYQDHVFVPAERYCDGMGA